VRQLPINWLDAAISTHHLSERAQAGVDIAKALQAGASREQLADEYQCSVSTLYRWKDRAIEELAHYGYSRALGLPEPESRLCACGTNVLSSLYETKRRRYCFDACRIAAFRARRRIENH
jgi:hypothetical protein